MKKITFGGKPSANSPHLSADAWVNDRDPGQPMKRLTIDVPLGLHTRIKTQCAVEGLKMADVIRDMLDGRFPPAPAEGNPAGASAIAERQKIVSP